MTFNPITLRARLMLSPDGVESGGTTFSSGSPEITETAASPNGNAAIPDITVLSDNSYILLWHEDSGTGQYSSKWQRFDASGTAITPVNTFAGNAHAVSALANGGFAISYSVWQDMRVQRFDSASSAVGDPVIVDSTPYNNSPVVTGLPDGGFVTVWSSDPTGTGYGNVLCRRYDANGVAQGGAQQVNAETQGSLSSCVTALADGGFIVAWLPQSYDLAWGRGIAIRRYDASGQPVNGTEIAVAPTAASDPYFDVAALVDGGWVVSWSSDKDDIKDVYAQVYNADGTARGTEIHMALPDYQFGAHVTGLSDGGFMLAWSGRGPAGGGDTDIFGQRFSASGAAVGDTIVLNDTLSGSQSAPVLAARSDGGFVVAWQTDGTYDFMNPSSGMTRTGGSVSVRTYRSIITHLDVSEDTPRGAGFADIDPAYRPGLTYSVLTQPATGSVIDNGDGTFRFDPAGQFEDLAAGETRDVTFTYRATDETGATRDVAFTVAVAGANDAPTAQADLIQGASGQPVTIDVATLLANDSDAESDPLSLLSVQNAENGSVSLGSDGTLIFTPVLGVDGPFRFTYTVADTHGATATQTVTLDLVPATPPDIVVIGQEQTTQGTAPTDGTVTAPTIAVLADGGHVLVWREERNGSGPAKWQRFDANGVALSPASVLLDSQGYDVYAPAVTATADGGFAFVYGTGFDHVEVQRFDSASVSQGAPVQVDGSDFFTHSRTPDIAQLGDGGFVVTWRDEWQDSLQVRRFGADGQPIGQAQQVNDGFVGYQPQPIVTGLADGGYLIAWQAQVPDDEWTLDVHLRRFDASGQPVGADITVGATSSDESQPVITALADGGWVVAFLATRSGALELHMQVFNANGSFRGAEQVLPTQGAAGSPQLAALADGGFLLAWSGAASAAGGSDVIGQRFDADGAPDGGLFVLNQETKGEQTTLALAGRADGGFVASWKTVGDWTYDEVHGWTFGSDTIGLRVFSGQVSAITSGGSGNDLLVGSSGNDILVGGDGADTYLAGNRWGADTIVNQGHGGDGDRVLFGPGVDRGHLWLEQQANDLKVTIIGTADSVTVKDWFVSSDNRVAQLATADGSVLDVAQVQNLVDAMASFAPPPLGQTELTADQQVQLEPVIAANWH